MNSHLGRFPKVILERPGVQESSFYKAVFQWISALVEVECNLLEIHPQKLVWLDEKTLDLSCCGQL